MRILISVSVSRVKKGKTRAKEGHRPRVRDENFTKSRHVGEGAGGAREGRKRRVGGG